MEFCQKCGAVLIIKGEKITCPRCGYSKRGKVKLVVSEKIEEKKIVNIVSEKDSEIYPVVDLEQPCKNCKNTRAYFWTMQTRSTDEAETKFFKCIKCQFTWREYR